MTVVDVEKRATIAIDDVLSRCDKLVGYIDSNDKTPMTDGFIQIYRGLGRRKEEMVGRVDVQVKGRTHRHKLAPGSFSMTRADLEATRQHGTILLFVCFVRPDGSYVSGPKYAILSPYTVGSFLSEMKRKARSFAVPLRDLPTGIAEVESIVHIAYRTKRQSFFAGTGGLEILERSEEITISSARNLAFDEPVLISPRTGDFVVEVKTPDGILVPLPGEFEILPASYVETPLEATVRCGTSTYTSATKRQTGPEEYEVRLSGGLTLTNTYKNGQLQTGSASLDLVPNLLERIRDIDFFLALADGTPLYFDDQELIYEQTTKGVYDDLEAVRARLAQMVTLLESLNVDCRLIDVDALDERQRKQLGYLYGSLFKAQGIKAEDTDSPTALVSSQVGAWQLYMLLMPSEDGTKGVAVDPFNLDNRDRFQLYSRDESGEVVAAEATVYEMIDREELPLVLNLNLKSIVDAYKRIAGAPAVTWLANRTVLRLIHAADDCEPRRDEFLDAADALNDWLSSIEASVGASLNKFQIKARRTGGLADEDRGAIRAIRRELVRSGADDTALPEAGCAILLGDEEELAARLAELSDEAKRDLEGYPIWSLRTPPAITS